MSTRSSETVDLVWNVFPHEQCTDAIWYSGWMPCFMLISPRMCLVKPTRLSAGRCLCDLFQELLVGLRRADLVGEQLERRPGLERVQHPAELPHEGELLGLQQ